MQAIVLAAGEGSRMRPLTSHRPKVMLPVAGKPFLEHILSRGREAGLYGFVLVVGYCQEAVRSYFGDGRSLGVKIDYAVQEKQLGTGHALLAAEAQCQDRFVVLNGDVLPDTDSLKRIAQSEDMIAASVRVSDPSRYGVFSADAGYMKLIIEKSSSPPSNLANAGIYLLSREIFDALDKAPISERGEIELTDGLNILAAEKRIMLLDIEDWLEIGRPWDILEANEKLMASLRPGILGEVEPGATLKGRVSVGRRTVVRSGAYIEGPTIIGEDCDIGPNCYIRPSSCIGDRVRIGNGVEIKNSTIVEGTKIGHLSYLGDSVIGSGCNFGAGTIVANLRHDNAAIISYVKGQKEDTGRRKLGVIMGDNVKTGIHTTIYPGTVIEAGFWGRPAAVLRGFVASQDIS
jgi:bifunctional UDP-N-acetylglucosamine pyrophosphorylase/glucosamine-1-phosphate N-acetyltransferase